MRRCRGAWVASGTDGGSLSGHRRPWKPVWMSPDATNPRVTSHVNLSLHTGTCSHDSAFGHGSGFSSHSASRVLMAPNTPSYRMTDLVNILEGLSSSHARSDPTDSPTSMSPNTSTVLHPPRELQLDCNDPTNTNPICGLVRSMKAISGYKDPYVEISPSTRTLIVKNYHYLPNPLQPTTTITTPTTTTSSSSNTSPKTGSRSPAPAPASPRPSLSYAIPFEKIDWLATASCLGLHWWDYHPWGTSIRGISWAKGKPRSLLFWKPLARGDGVVLKEVGGRKVGFTVQDMDGFLETVGRLVGGVVERGREEGRKGGRRWSAGHTVNRSIYTKMARTYNFANIHNPSTCTFASQARGLTSGPRRASGRPEPKMYAQGWKPTNSRVRSHMNSSNRANHTKLADPMTIDVRWQRDNVNLGLSFLGYVYRSIIYTIACKSRRGCNLVPTTGSQALPPAIITRTALPDRETGTTTKPIMTLANKLQSSAAPDVHIHINYEQSEQQGSGQHYDPYNKPHSPQPGYRGTPSPHGGSHSPHPQHGHGHHGHHSPNPYGSHSPHPGGHPTGMHNPSGESHTYYGGGVHTQFPPGVCPHCTQHHNYHFEPCPHGHGVHHGPEPCKCNQCYRFHTPGHCPNPVVHGGGTCIHSMPPLSPSGSLSPSLAQYHGRDLRSLQSVPSAWSLPLEPPSLPLWHLSEAPPSWALSSSQHHDRRDLYSVLPVSPAAAALPAGSASTPLCTTTRNNLASPSTPRLPFTAIRARSRTRLALALLTSTRPRQFVCAANALTPRMKPVPPPSIAIHARNRTRLALVLVIRARSRTRLALALLTSTRPRQFVCAANTLTPRMKPAPPPSIAIHARNRTRLALVLVIRARSRILPALALLTATQSS
ncbi:hypothetical protein G7K_1403-t1 [Saitoella complicata NRRL Y-17804]|uniref:Uncharacterized protein n=1 Tax=Saitoella complicata (strain BCRC 22490 / CBS 7301 / JCM 7358 / NBRC 10748 / NRRL Y-17804) TaxID=698492 RepID=A0A0E9NBL1_SAICN|nr:hypothetical protein G7K_1403-t1 [Saitoella complicata NRRL Y-17804]